MSTIHVGQHITQCKSPKCRRSIMWATSKNGEPMPLDPRPSPKGNVVVEEHRGQLYADVLRPIAADGARHAGRDLYLHHKATCPDADKWRTRPRPRTTTRRPRR